jgi:hypothetical protein
LEIVLIGAYLRNYSYISIKEYYDEFMKDKLDSIDIGEISIESTRHEAAVRITFEPEWKILEEGRVCGSSRRRIIMIFDQH